MGRRARRRQDVPLPGRRGDARAQPALVRRAPPAALPGRSLAGRAPLRGAVHLLRRRVPLLRGGAPLHLRLLRRARGLQARLGLPRLLSVLLLRRPLVASPSARTRTRRRAAARVLRRWSSSPAGRSRAAPICRSSTSRRDPTAKAFGVLAPARDLGRRQARAGERLLGALAPHQLPRRDPDGHGARALPRPSARPSRRGSIRSTTSRCWCRGSIDDDRRCAEKYGPLWDEYCRRVPYRIIPGIY